MTVFFRRPQLNDLDALVELENQCFATDKLSRRSFRHWLGLDAPSLLVAEIGRVLAGYILVIHHRGTRLARLYSLAVAPAFRGQGLAKGLIQKAEALAREEGYLYLRLEVSVDNQSAIRCYEALGYQRFGLYRDYYQDHKDALRYQKCIRRYRDLPQHRELPWLRQTTPFTCGPASLMMAMHGLNADYLPSRDEEIQIWREATTIFMTSGHGGCHPIGLALAAYRRGFAAEVWLNQSSALFIDGVRDENKKQVMNLVDDTFRREAAQLGIALNVGNVTQELLIAAYEAGALPLVLISTYAFDRKKAPHWVLMSGYDSNCLYLHDPDPDEARQSELDCQFIPVARHDFERMSCFGKSRLRTAVIIARPEVHGR